MDDLTKLKLFVEIANERFIRLRNNIEEKKSEFYNRDDVFKEIMLMIRTLQETNGLTDEDIELFFNERINHKY